MLGLIKPSHQSELYDTDGDHTLLAPPGLGQEWNIEHIDLTGTEVGPNTVTISIGSNTLAIHEFAGAGDYRAIDPRDLLRCGDNQPVLVNLSAAKGVRINITYYKLPKLG